MYEVDAPDMVGMGWPQPDDRSILVIEPPALLVPLRQLKSLFAPDPLNLLVVHPPAFDAQQLRYLAIAVAAVLLRQPDQSQPQGVIVSIGRLVMQGAARQANHPAGPSLRRRELLARMDNSLTKLPGRQALGFRWLRLSFRISLSSSSSATIFFSLAFSFSRLRSSDRLRLPHPAKPLAPVVIRSLADTHATTRRRYIAACDSFTSISRSSFSMSSSECRFRAIASPFSSKNNGPVLGGKDKAITRKRFASTLTTDEIALSLFIVETKTILSTAPRTRMMLSIQYSVGDS